MLKLNKTYTIITLVVLAAEVYITLVFKDGFIRYTLGDFLATILVYCALKISTNLKPSILFFTTLTIAFTIEGFQYINILKTLQLQSNKLLKIILGSHFSIQDLIAYTLGALLIYLIDKHTTNETLIKNT